jgi:hypothetical protein
MPRNEIAFEILARRGRVSIGGNKPCDADGAPLQGRRRDEQTVAVARPALCFQDRLGIGRRRDIEIGRGLALERARREKGGVSSVRRLTYQLDTLQRIASGPALVRGIDTIKRMTPTGLPPLSRRYP